ncbi:RHS repeat-associated core domain-containing protein [Flagellimonas taeanensis]|uniref:RHS repeat-associated core domain-containing protein n=1 Tax=Flagellimonas taeanensis TaxID=1005926 RepID=A0A1M7ATM3_9FLAO|nr:DUF6443 domain-containing protein [Allomuricauda taeanensis]SFC35964.1 RHS repeat-associated core domain-containing protein [Allomuricauda taeanensis]SHL46084.1 RHS repeat-associated core domain-containing protein [Allomuricauda taeanensis]
MKTPILLLLLLGYVQVSAQTYTKNFTKSYEPKTAYSVSELTNLVGDADTDPSLTLNTTVSSGTYEAKKSITLANGFHATGNVHVRIMDSHPNILENITYTDGLGRPIQSIAREQSPNGYDIVSFVEYDQFGRDAKKYLPYPTTQKSGELVSNPSSAQTSYYQNQYGDSYGYSLTIFDDSPLNRMLEASSPGYDWRVITGSDNDHTIKREYGTNAANSGVFKFIIDDSGSTPVITRYLHSVTDLLKNVVKNENWQPADGLLNTVETYSDKNGRILARIIYEDVSGTPTKRITQNVYDTQGRLRYILPPKALEGLGKPLASGSAYTIDHNLVYQYQYDQYNRQIAQRVPGRDWEYLVYDQLDRPILTQDANLAASGKWLFTKYDAFGRPIYSGTYSSTKTRAQLQTDVDNYINGNTGNESNIEERTTGTTTVGGIAMNYTNDAFPISGISEVLSVNYYDNYTFTDADKPTTPTTVQGQTVTTRTQGLQTANFSKTIGQTSWTKLYTYYDEKGREIKIYNKNHLGGYTTTDSQLDFRGKTDLAVTKHKRTSGSTELVINDRFTYDYAERQLGHYQQINSQTEERIVENEFDELGMLAKKKVGGSSASSTPLQEMVYEYNIKGQLKMLNDVAALGDKLFAYKINYNSAAEGSSSAPARYDGSISQTIWQSAYDNTKRSYAYLYDDLNRLSESKYQYNSSLNGNSGSYYNTQYTYDTHGNISTLSRRNGTGSIIDQLTYDYGTSNGNQLLSVSDSGTSAGFVDGNTSGNDYAYDNNGNMTQDLNKSISQITYNHLDLVNTVSLPSNKSLEFQYDASGSKLQKKYKNGSTILSTVDYLGGFQYTDGTLQFFPTPSGYVYKSGSTYKYMYLYTDHLGNTRVSYTDTNSNGAIESTEVASNRNYYPFGGGHSGEYVDGLAAVYKYTFQGKEYQDEDGLNWNDFGSRMYDPALGRWMATDPQNQFGSPYLAMGNNPISSIDPDGQFAILPVLIGAAIGGTFGGVSAAKSGGDFFDIVGGSIKGLTIGAAAGAAGQILPLPANVQGLAAAPYGAINGFSAGFTAGFLGNLNSGFNGAFSSGLKSGRDGAILGALTSGFEGAKRAVRDGNNPITGNSKNIAGGDGKIGKIKNGFFKRRIITKVEMESIRSDAELVNELIASGYDPKDLLHIDEFRTGYSFTKTISSGGYTENEIFWLDVRDASRTAQLFGEGIQWAGFGLTATGVGSGIGQTVYEAGGALSLTGEIGEALYDHNIGGAIYDAAWEKTTSRITSDIILKRLPQPLRASVRPFLMQSIERGIHTGKLIKGYYYKF